MSAALQVGTNGITLEQREAYIEHVCVPCRDDLWLWIQKAYPWGVPGSVLEHREPAPWQKKLAIAISKDLKAMRAGTKKKKPIMWVIKSGHGVGKSTFMGWANDWNLATSPGARGTCTANTEDQLKDKTWAELLKWHKMSLSRPFFTWTATTYMANDKEWGKNWSCKAQSWSERTPEAIAGLHNAGNRVLLCFDEASAIPKIIFETVMGAFTDDDTICIWLVFGNPTRNSGPFYECFNKYKKMWNRLTLDSREVPGTNLEVINGWVDTYGEDSDFVRIRVRGIFPRRSAQQFISTEVVEESMARKAAAGFDDILICGIDLARNGDCASVMYWRKGRDGKSIPPDIYPDDPNSEVFVAKCAARLKDMQPDLIFADGGGLGGPIIDRLNGLGFDVIEIQSAWPAIDEEHNANRRVEMWAKGKEWLKTGAVWDSEEFKAELTVIEAMPNARGRNMLESKESLQKRGEASPDIADAFMLTFAYDITPELQVEKQQRQRDSATTAEQKYEHWADMAPVSGDDKYRENDQRHERMLRFEKSGIVQRREK